MVEKSAAVEDNLKAVARLATADDVRLNEALVMFPDMPEWRPTPEETFIWVVTKTDSRWIRSELGTPSLQREVAAPRCGLDYDGTWGASGSRCRDLIKTS